jgi:type IX secretion system PorP/SprF family membrane protein
MKPKILTLLLCGSLAATETVFAQSISFKPLSSAPLMLNPAFTGLFDGKLRANVLYRHEWRSVTLPNLGMAASVDMPIHTGKNKYWAVGGQLFRGVAGDGTLNNFYGLASLAFHQKLKHNIRIGVGVQGGYTQKYLDMSQLYFNQIPAPSFWPLPRFLTGLGNTVNTYAINVGASFCQDVNHRFNYSVALSANNINQPNDAIERRMRRSIGDDTHGNVVLMANWQVTNRFGVRPSFLYQVSMDRQNLIGGSEFHFGFGADKAKATPKNSAFAGLWYRSGETASITAGVEILRFRAYLGYDYHLSMPGFSDGNGGVEVAARYILPGRKTTAK